MVRRSWVCSNCQAPVTDSLGQENRWIDVVFRANTVREMTNDKKC